MKVSLAVRGRTLDTEQGSLPEIRDPEAHSVIVWLSLVGSQLGIGRDTSLRAGKILMSTARKLELWARHHSKRTERSWDRNQHRVSCFIQKQSHLGKH